jgi:chromosome segregation ATPase
MLHLCVLLVMPVFAQAGSSQLALGQQSSVPAKPQLAVMQLQLGATRREVAQLQASLASTERQHEEACGQLVAERARAAALRAEDQRIASSHRELQEAWKGMVDELKAQLKVIKGNVGARRWTG